MNLSYSDLDWAQSKIEKLIKANPNRSVSALFRKFRNSPRTYPHGDYEILARIVDSFCTVGIQLNRNKVRYALNQSSEFSSYAITVKKTLLDQLTKLSYVQTKRDKLPLKKTQMRGGERI